MNPIPLYSNNHDEVYSNWTLDNDDHIESDDDIGSDEEFLEEIGPDHFDNIEPNLNHPMFKKPNLNKATIITNTLTRRDEWTLSPETTQVSRQKKGTLLDRCIIFLNENGIEPGAFFLPTAIVFILTQIPLWIWDLGRSLIKPTLVSKQHFSSVSDKEREAILALIDELDSELNKDKEINSFVLDSVKKIQNVTDKNPKIFEEFPGLEQLLNQVVNLQGLDETPNKPMVNGRISDHNELEGLLEKVDQEEFETLSDDECSNLMKELGFSDTSKLEPETLEPEEETCVDLELEFHPPIDPHSPRSE